MIKLKIKKITYKRKVRLLLFALATLYYLFWGYEKITFDPFAQTSIFSNHCDTPLYPVIEKALEDAQESIFLQIYTLQDHKVVRKLEEKAAQGLQVVVMQDPKTALSLKGIETIRMPTNGLMHRKALVIDEEKIILGSANLTVDSLHVDDNLLITLKDKTLAKSIKEMKPCKVSLEEQAVEFWPLPESKKEALARLIGLIESSRFSIQVSMFTWTHPLLTEKIIEAHKRGVTILVILDRKQTEGASKASLEALAKSGVPVRLSGGSQTFHHKFALIDASILVAGSANWTKAAFSKNEECLLIIEHLTPKQLSTLNHLLNVSRASSMKFTVKKPVVDLRLEPKEIAPTGFSQEPQRLTQLLYNEKLSLIKAKGPWLLVEALEQSHYTAEKQWHFYSGWVHSSEVQEVKDFRHLTHVVSTSWTPTGLSFGTYLTPEDVADSSLARPLHKPFDRTQLIQDARCFLGAPYLWGGRAAFAGALPASVDCSGFINLLYRAQGITVPRDAHPQALFCQKISKNQLQPGDLIYLRRLDGAKVSHVLLYNEETFIDSPKTGHFVQELAFKTHYSEENGIVRIKGREHPYAAHYGRFI